MLHSLNHDPDTTETSGYLENLMVVILLPLGDELVDFNQTKLHSWCIKIFGNVL
jgi:hypothetical protein